MDGKTEIIFSHKWEIQTGGNRKCCNLRSRSSKILKIQEQFQNKPEKVAFFKYISSIYQKNSRTIQEIQGIPEPLATLKNVLADVYILH